MTKKKKTIIYIMSDVRSGSTLLENILSYAPKTISVGELHHLDSHLYRGKWGKTWNWNCSCGKSIVDCEFWKKILNNLKRKNIKISATTLNSENNVKNEIREKFNLDVINHINEIYTAIFDEANVDVIIDSSKHKRHGILLYKNSNYNIRIVYLKRDIRAVSISKAKWANKFQQKRKNLLNILVRTKLYEIKTKKLLKSIPQEHFISIRYEELAKQPQIVANRISEKFRLSYFDAPKYMDYTNKHTIGGTPSRFETRKIKYDSSWEIKAKQKPVFYFIGGLINSV